MNQPGASSPALSNTLPGLPVMRQRWQDLLFLHWRYDASVLRPLIPEGLELDTFEGDTYASIVAFRMLGVRPIIAPPLPWLSYFNEFNMRLYVRDARGTPGVYFISLDCDRLPAVWLARTFFSLPYLNARIDFVATPEAREGHDSFQVSCQRTSQVNECSYSWRTNGDYRIAAPGTLDFFLTERYHFFVRRKGHLQMGEVRHEPYRVCVPELIKCGSEPFIWNGLVPPASAPDLAHYSLGVDVTAFWLKEAN